MKAIKRFIISPAIPGPQTIQMPKGAEILSLQTVGGMPAIFARVNDSHEEEPRKFELYATDTEVNEFDLQYVGTAILQADQEIHVFENK